MSVRLRQIELEMNASLPDGVKAHCNSLSQILDQVTETLCPRAESEGIALGLALALPAPVLVFHAIELPGILHCFITNSLRQKSRAALILAVVERHDNSAVEIEFAIPFARGAGQLVQLQAQLSYGYKPNWHDTPFGEDIFLGLSVCRAMVEGLRGRMGHRLQGEDVVMWFTLPLTKLGSWAECHPVGTKAAFYTLATAQPQSGVAEELGAKILDQVKLEEMLAVLGADLFAGQARAFCREILQTLPQLDEARLAGHMQTCAALCHKLAGAAAMFGAGTLADSLLQAETDARAQNNVLFNGTWPGLIAQARKVAAALADRAAEVEAHIAPRLRA